MLPHFRATYVRIVGVIAVAGLLFGMSNVPGNASATFAATPAATSQSGKGIVTDTVNPGEQKIGEINATNSEYRFAITGSGGDRVLTGITGEEGFAPALEIRAGGADTRGSTLATALPDPQTTGSLLLNYTLFKNGTYTLVVTAGKSKGRKTGRFVLTFGLVTFKKPVNGIATGDVLPTNGFPIIGVISYSVSQILYKVQAKANDKLVVTMTGYNGLVPALAISPGDYGDTAAKLLTAEAKPESANPIASLEYQVQHDGSFVITASRAGFEKGKTSGPYIISLSVNSASVQDVLEPSNAFEEPSPMPYTIDVTGDASTVISKLHDSSLVPDGGELAANLVKNIYLKASTPGLKSLNLLPDSDISARNFVANIQVNWTQAGANSACGIAFWSVGTVEFAAALLGNDGQVTLIQRSSSLFPISYIDSSTLYDPAQVNTITLLVFGSKVSLYINGKLQTTQDGKSKYGAIDAMLFNDKGNTKLTVCQYPSGWIWRF